MAALIAPCIRRKGSRAVNLLADALVWPATVNSRLWSVITKGACRYSLQAGKKPTCGELVGKTYGLGVSGFKGSVLEIEAVAFPAAAAGKGRIRFNETAGSMARDSVFNAAAVIRRLTGEDLQNYDLHVNVIGGGQIDGPRLASC